MNILRIDLFVDAFHQIVFVGGTLDLKGAQRFFLPFRIELEKEKRTQSTTHRMNKKKFSMMRQVHGDNTMVRKAKAKVKVTPVLQIMVGKHLKQNSLKNQNVIQLNHVLGNIGLLILLT